MLVLAGNQASDHPSLARHMVHHLVKGLGMTQKDPRNQRFLDPERKRYTQALAHRFLHVGFGLYVLEIAGSWAAL